MDEEFGLTLERWASFRTQTRNRCAFADAEALRVRVIPGFEQPHLARLQGTARGCCRLNKVERERLQIKENHGNSLAVHRG
jgi:hypothetical protein